MAKLGSWTMALVGVGVLVCTSLAGADCGADHKAATPGKPEATVAKDGKLGDQSTAKAGDKSTVVVVGAPGHSVEVTASPGQSVSAVGGAGAPGKAGAAGKPSQ